MERADYRYSKGGRQDSLFLYGVYSLLVLIWGSTWFVIRVSLAHYPPFFTLAARFLVAGSCFLAYVLWKKIPIPWSLRYGLFYVGVGLLSFVVSYGVVYWGEQYVSSGLAAVIFGLLPIFTALSTRLFLRREHVDGRAWVGLLLGLGGIVLINSGDLEQMHAKAPLASLILVIGPLVTAVSTVISKHAVTRIHPFVIAGIPMLLAGFVHLGIWFLVERHVALTWSWPGVWATAYLTLPGTLITFGGYYWLMQHIRVSTLNLIAYMSPVLALALGFFLAEEPLTWTILAGAALIFSGVSLAGRKQR